MDTFRKWLNKPKADDKSLLARFYHADHALTAVASELDSFDGRAEPERCSRLVGKLRTGQEHVLAITNQIMDELLGDERGSRAFRAKFPEEVLQESLAGQLWFGAECLAAGSSILNRETESALMRPLAKAVTKSLDNVRNLLREQCLRNNTPNSLRMNLNLNDASTEQLCESLKIFDKLFAEFELRYVSAMVTVKTKQEHETQELICVLFSETVHRALKLDLLDQDQVDSFDPALMFSIPRLAIVAGLVIFRDGPLNMDMADGQLSEMFRPFRTLLMKIRDLLRSLNKDQLRQLERLLCTNEDVTSSTHSQTNRAPIRSTKEAAEETTNWPTAMGGDDNNKKKKKRSNDSRVFLVHASSSEDEEDDDDDDVDSIDKELQTIEEIVNTLNVYNSEDIVVGAASFPTPALGASATTTATTTAAGGGGEGAAEDDQIDVINDCASGYLIPNTNLGYLLQPNRPTDDYEGGGGAPLTDSFISTENDDEDDDPESIEGEGEEEEPGSRCLVDHFIDNISTKSASSTSTTGTTSSTSSSTSTTTNTGESSPTWSSSTASLNSVEDRRGSSNHNKCLTKDHEGAEAEGGNQDSGMCTETNSSDDRSPESELAATKVQEQEEEGERDVPSCSRAGRGSASQRRSGSGHRRRHHHRNRSNNNNHHHHSASASYLRRCVAYPSTSGGDSGLRRISREETDLGLGTSAALEDDQVAPEIAEAIRDATKNHENLLHRLFVCIAGVADQLQTNFASDLRKILRSVFLMNVSPPEPVIDANMRIQLGDSKASDVVNNNEEINRGDDLLFEYRPSENEVNEDGSGVGSNQSINSAEEVNPEMGGDNVFEETTAGAPSTPIKVKQQQQRSVSEEQAVRHQRPQTDPGTGGGALTERQRNINNSGNGGDSMGGGGTVTRSHSLGDTSTIAQDGGQSHLIRTRIRTTSSSVVESTRPHTVLSRQNGGRGHRDMIQRPPRWIPDEEAPRCMGCATLFTAFRRRHHCRHCGRVFCGICSNVSAPIPKYGFVKAVRVCQGCYTNERELGTTTFS